MDSVTITLENGIQSLVNGVFYVFDSRYFFMYTQGEYEDNDYVKLYISQISREVQNTTSGPVQTGNMVGTQVSDQNDFINVINKWFFYYLYYLALSLLHLWLSFSVVMPA